MSVSEIGFAPSTLEVDYDKNLTDLYKAITDQDWERAVEVCKSDPEQAKTWVVRHFDDDEEEEGEIMWRFLPLHSACARQPPMSVVASLLRAYPDGAKCQDDQGMHALHYACGNQATRDVVRILLVSYPDAAKKQDPRGMLPIHYLACWGPSSVSVVDMLLVANPNVAMAKDSEGNTPLDLARDGEYPEKDAVISVLQKWFSNLANNDSTSQDGTTGSSSKRSLGRFSTDKSTTATTTTAATGASSAGLNGYTSGSGSRNRSSRRSTSTSRNRSSPAKATKSVDPVMPPKKTRESTTARYAPRSVEPEGAEEKKEEDDYLAPFASSRREPPSKSVSQDDYKKLQDELATLRADKAAMETKLNESDLRCDVQEGEILELQDALSKAKLSNDREQEGALDVSRDLERTKAKLRGCNEELRGLRITMVDMMEEHDELKQRESNMNDRLTSLSVSLEAVMAQQKELAKMIKSRQEERRSASHKRGESLRKLLEMEEVNAEEDAALELKLKKQTKEMEALSAMIEAARD